MGESRKIQPSEYDISDLNTSETYSFVLLYGIVNVVSYYSTITVLVHVSMFVM